MFWVKKEPEKPNYGKIIGITLAIIAGIAAVGYAAYLYCKKMGIHCCICKSGSADDENWDDLEDLEFDEDNAEDVEVEVEDKPE